MADVVKRDKAIPETTAFQLRTTECNEIVFSMCSLQCGSMEAKAVVNQARVYICNGRAGGSERHLRTFRPICKKWTPPHPVRDV